jgi:hypothetical protein
MNELTELLRPHVAEIQSAAKNGDMKAQQIINLYKLYQTCPQDPGAPALCRAAFDDWRETNPVN